ncbi:MAG: hypothetical protein KAT32_01140 [Candidatus Moranbacteria bacterium]|nr:hypothetical protein [Candidatus Moranbacteria bacterium]
MNRKNFFLKQLNTIIEEYDVLKSHGKQNNFLDKKEDLSTLITKAKTSIQRIVGNSSEYYKELTRILETEEYDGIKLKPVIGIVIALRDDLNNDYLKNLGEIIHSEVFTDFIEMAEYLLSEEYKDATAVIVGSTFESHLKKLCLKNSIDIKLTNKKGDVVSKKAGVLNSELYKKSIYNLIMQKQIIVWLGLRNNAAHGQYSEYNKDDVDLMIKGIINFIASYPA